MRFVDIINKKRYNEELTALSAALAQDAHVIPSTLYVSFTILLIRFPPYLLLCTKFARFKHAFYIFLIFC